MSLLTRVCWGTGIRIKSAVSVIYAFRKIYTFTQQIYATSIPQSILRITHYAIPQSINTRFIRYIVVFDSLMCLISLEVNKGLEVNSGVTGRTRRVSL